jgi:hypothetical protein
MARYKVVNVGCWLFENDKKYPITEDDVLKRRTCYYKDSRTVSRHKYKPVIKVGKIVGLREGGVEVSIGDDKKKNSNKFGGRIFNSIYVNEFTQSFEQ